MRVSFGFAAERCDGVWRLCSRKRASRAAQFAAAISVCSVNRLSVRSARGATCAASAFTRTTLMFAKSASGKGGARKQKRENERCFLTVVNVHRQYNIASLDYLPVFSKDGFNSRSPYGSELIHRSLKASRSTPTSPTSTYISISV